MTVQETAAVEVQLLQGGQVYFPALVRAMENAQAFIHLETYIFDFHGSGVVVAMALEASAQRGVKVTVVVDGVGTPSVPQEWVERWSTSGVQWRVYSKPGRFGLLNPKRWRRMHRKLCVVDGRIAFCGGINVLDDLYDPNHGPLDQPRFDFAVQLQGPIVAEIDAAVGQLWWRLNASRHLREHRIQEAVDDIRRSDFHRPHWDAWAQRLRQSWGRKPVPPLPAELVTFLLRDNVSNRSRIESAYREALALAQHSVIIANAYFLPGQRLRRALIAAAQRGVHVQILVQGRYEYFMQYHATRTVYGELMRAGIEIHEYTASFLHAKVAVIDAGSERAWATVGSSNLDPLSLLLAREANVVVTESKFAEALAEILLQALARDSVRVAGDDHDSRSWFQRTKEFLALTVLRLGLWVTGKRY